MTLMLCDLGSDKTIKTWNLVIKASIYISLARVSYTSEKAVHRLVRMSML